MSVGRGVFWKKTTVEQCNQLDMTYLTREFDFESRSFGIVNWKSSWGKRSLIGIQICAPNSVRLSYTTIKQSTGEKTKSDYYVHLDRTPCNYGGHRWWFLCPNCGRRCRILYFGPSSIYFACRICHNLTYTSQQEGCTRCGALFKAINELPDLERRFMRTRSERKRAKLERKISRLNRGLSGIILWGNLKRRKRKR